MDETMNLNGMGIGSSVQAAPVAASAPVENNNVDVSNVTAETPVSSENSVEVTPTPQISETNTIEEANNDNSFEDMDMIKELREEEANRRKNDSIFSSMDFGPLKKYLEDDDVTDISYSNGGQLWLKTLSKGVYRVEEEGINDALIEKIAFQCSNVMGKTFNMAHPFLDSESAELRMNFIHDSIARNGIAVVFRKTPAKIRLEKDKLMKENYVSLSIHDFLIKAVQGHCNIIMCGETGSGKTEFLKYLASHTFENEKIVTVEDTLELHLDRIFPHRDIVAMKTNNVASYSDVLVTCMRQNPIWILLSEVRSAEAVTAVRNSISSGHFILSTIHADKASNIPYRLYSLLESNIDVEQFLNTIYRYVQLGVFLRGRFDPQQGKYVREIGEVTEFYVNDNNECISNTIYQKTIKGDVTYKPISEHLLDYLEGQGIDMTAIRESNGDLEKAQSYSDEHDEKSEEEKVTPITEEIKPITGETPKADSPQEEKIEPITSEVKPITEEIKPITEEIPKADPPQEEKVVPITSEVKPITEEIKPITQDIKPVSDIITPVAPATQTPSSVGEVSQDVTPVTVTPVTEKVIPITQDIKPQPAAVSTPNGAGNDINVVPVDSLLNSNGTTSESGGTNSGVNFSTPNITNIQ